MHILVVIIMVAIDQITKIAAQQVLRFSEPIILINNFLQLNYVENKGAAFGILQNQRIFFVVMTLVVLVAIVYYRYKNNKLTGLSRLIFDFIIAGAIGNLIDRIRMIYVIDFIDVNFWGFYDFPVFNFADVFLVCGTILLSLMILLDKHELG
ncbi:MAG: Lipoprotein signal peptidase [Clostridiales bacterium 38_11]|nr:MAG: Lipoprotein signal peptidase [Clostridiales bacterium 38_11]HBH12156.1 signal peptidase II [Clostridiales bacterium]